MTTVANCRVYLRGSKSYSTMTPSTERFCFQSSLITCARSKICSNARVCRVRSLKGTSHHLPQLCPWSNRLLSSTVTNKTKILQQFKEENSPIKVILLSLEKAASGTNLVEATHVVLLDPMSGTVEEARAYENQAIGRAYRQGQTQRVTVVRFIVNDTAEQELYQRNKSTSNGKKDYNSNANLQRLIRIPFFQHRGSRRRDLNWFARTAWLHLLRLRQSWSVPEVYRKCWTIITTAIYFENSIHNKKENWNSKLVT